MNKASKSWSELRAMEELAAGNSPVHRLHPLAKLLVTVLYIVLTVSFPKYRLSGVAAMVLFPVFLFQATGLSLSACFYKLRLVLPLVLAVGVANPFLDRAPMLYLGTLPVSGGVISMLTLMCKGVFSLMASYLLAATTRIDALCASLRKLRVPELLVTLFLLTYRYIAVMAEQVGVMSDAYALRAPGQKGVHVSAWGSFLGQLLLRSMDRATELYQSMRQRGFDGGYRYLTVPPFRAADWGYCLGSAALLALLRGFDIAHAIGNLLIAVI